MASVLFVNYAVFAGFDAIIVKTAFSVQNVLNADAIIGYVCSRRKQRFV